MSPAFSLRSLLAIAFGLLALTLPASAFAQEKPRVLVLTDISNEPDDEESLVRFLVYANEYDVEGLIATTSTWLKQGPREDLIRRHLAAYAEVRSTLLKHAPGFPASEQLAAVTCTGQTGFGMAFVGEGKSTAGSQQLIAATDRADERPLWVTVWGGANTLAQALHDVRAQRTPAELARFVAKLRVYSISDQDDAGPWLRRDFPELSYIVSPTRPDGQEYFRATWTGISGDHWYKNGPQHKFYLVENPWLEEHVSKNHGPLGALYPKFAYIMEGDTPSFLGLVDNGLGSSTNPAFGGWGGRYVLYQPLAETRAIWTNHQGSRDTVTADNGITETSDQATIWRWREHFQNDFAARMNWCVAATFAQANHNPRLVLNNDHSKRVLTLPAKGGSEITLSAEGSDDPDGQPVSITWWIYSEAGTIRGATLSSGNGNTTTVHLPAVKKPSTLHIIAQAEDEGTPHLFAYRRMILEVSP